MKPNLLGIDLGTSAVKALLVDLEGKVLCSASAGYPILHPHPGWAEQDPQAWWEATVQAVRQLLAGAVWPESIAAIGFSGQMHGTVLLGVGGRLLSPAVIWPDQRTVGQVRELTGQFGAGRLIERAGSPLATGFQAATLRWIQEERPALWRQARQVLLPKDYLRWRLTGLFATDPSDASGTLLLDVRARDWSPELLVFLGIERSLLPAVQESIAVAGALEAQAAGELGLPAGVPVITGAGDTPAALLGAGVIDPETLLLNIGSGGQLGLPIAEVQVDPAGRLHTFCSALEPGREGAGWYKLGGILSAGLALRWLRDQVLGFSGEGAYEQMTALAAEVPPGARGLIFLPYLLGERTPHMDPQARGVFLGLTLQHGQAELVRAVLEGITLACYEAYRSLVESGVRPQRAILAGGGSQSPLWRQIVADVFDLPVQRLASSGGSAAGAALLAGAGVQLFDLASAARRWARYDPPVEPDPRRHARYQEILPLFQSAYQKLREDFPKLQDFS